MGTIAELAKYRSSLGEDPVAYLEGRAAEARKLASEAAPAQVWELMTDLAHWLEAMGKSADAASVVREAFEASREPLKSVDFGNYAGEAERGFENWIDRLQKEAAQPAWRTGLRIGLKCFELGGFRRSLETLEPALAEAPAEVLKDEEAGVELARGFSAAAAAASRLSAGMATLRKEPEAVEPGEAEELRRRALAHLARAAELGWKDFVSPDFDPIRGAQEFKKAEGKKD